MKSLVTIFVLLALLTGCGPVSPTQFDVTIKGKVEPIPQETSEPSSTAPQLQAPPPLTADQIELREWALNYRLAYHAFYLVHEARFIEIALTGDSLLGRSGTPWKTSSSDPYSLGWAMPERAELLAQLLREHPDPDVSNKGGPLLANVNDLFAAYLHENADGIDELGLPDPYFMMDILWSPRSVRSSQAALFADRIDDVSILQQLHFFTYLHDSVHMSVRDKIDVLEMLIMWAASKTDIVKDPGSLDLMISINSMAKERVIALEQGRGPVSTKAFFRHRNSIEQHLKQWDTEAAIILGH